MKPINKAVILFLYPLDKVVNYFLELLNLNIIPEGNIEKQSDNKQHVNKPLGKYWITHQVLNKYGSESEHSFTHRCFLKHNKIHSIFVQTDYHAFTIKPGASKHVKCFSWHHGGHASLNCNFSLMILQQIRNIFSSVFTRTLFVYAEATKVGQ